MFLLSIDEVNKYYSSDEARKCLPTAYAKAQGAWTSYINKTASGEAACWWWLRSPGVSQNFAAYVGDVGSVGCLGSGVPDVHVCVRPALWISLE